MTRRAHPLLRAFPLAVMTLATFLVVFTLMMARLTAGADPALRASSNTAALVAGSSAGAVSTRTSGAGAQGAATVQATAAEGASATTPAVVTRTSGTSGVVDD
jgi:hypothetical protein